MVLKVGTSSGIYYAARSDELSSSIKKLGYTLTRGVGAMEIAIDVAHEVTFTHGLEIRHMARKQGVQPLLHGDLQVPIEMPERGEWRDAQDRMKKSLQSGVWVGAKYVNFHACLNMWLEQITYAGRKLTFSFCDENGRFISEMFKNNPKLRKWFIQKKSRLFEHDIYTEQDRNRLNTRINIEFEKWYKNIQAQRIREGLGKIKSQIKVVDQMGRMADPKDVIEDVVNAVVMQGLAPRGFGPVVEKKTQEIIDSMRKERLREEPKLSKKIRDDFLEEKLSKGRKWESEEMRGATGVVEGYHIMAHYLFYSQDPVWKAMADQYRDLLKKYKYDPGNFYWLDEAWEEAEKHNDREYKEFFYAAVCAKYLEGHVDHALKWLHGDFINKEIPRYLSHSGLSKKDQEKEKKDLVKYAKEMIIGIENPDAREVQYAGLYPLWRPKQIYAAVKTIRKTIKTDKLMMIVDHEHIATQGVDALVESRETILPIKDYGEFVIAVHANHPNPLQPHAPLDMGDTVLYELLWNLRKNGMGQKRNAYLIFERGGGDDPFKQSIEILKIMAQFLNQDPPTPLKQLPLEFFGVEGLRAGDIQRQMQIVRDKATEPLKDLMEMVEEDWGILSQAAIRKGKKPEQWKKAALR